MAKFKIPAGRRPKPDSPRALFFDLRRDSAIKFLGDHQGKLLEEYQANHLLTKNLSIELPTGAGKTLVGLLLAEYRRLRDGWRAVYLCPTKQLCAQTHLQAKKYGVDSVILVGSKKEFRAADLLAYEQSDKVAIATYSAIFNVKPGLSAPDLIVCDDAHSAESYVSSLWTVRIDSKELPDLFRELVSLLGDSIPTSIRHFIGRKNLLTTYKTSVDLVSTVAVYEKLDRLRTLIEDSVSDANGMPNFRYSWSMVADHLDACAIYCSPESIEIRPIIAPAQSHAHFGQAHQRIYMSATLGDDGDLERTFGTYPIKRLATPELWEKQGAGRRFILFPTVGNDEQTTVAIAHRIVGLVSRALVCVPSDAGANRAEALVPDGYLILRSRDVESGIDSFTNEKRKCALILANRYDGIDLPGDACRMLVIVDLPTGVSLQERYLISRVGAVAQLRDRIRTRVTQAIGRCTRDSQDYSVVLAVGNELVNWLASKPNTVGMHPELQAEIEFGLENVDITPEQAVELATAFLNQDSEWQEADSAIRALRTTFDRKPDSVARALSVAAHHEIDFLYHIWRGKHDSALNAAGHVIEQLGGTELRPYRSYWHHEAAKSAFLAWKESNQRIYQDSCISHLESAAENSHGLKWLAQLKYRVMGNVNIQSTEIVDVQDWFNNINDLLADWGLIGAKFSRQLSQFKQGIQNPQAEKFEPSLQMLGRMLGLRSISWNRGAQGAPDGLWLFPDNKALVFEAKTGESPTDAISLATLREASTHEGRARQDDYVGDDDICDTVVITRQSTVDNVALQSASELASKLRYISHADVVELSELAAKCIDEVRSLAVTTTPEQLRDKAFDIYRSRRIDPDSAYQRFIKQSVTSLKTREGIAS